MNKEQVKQLIIQQAQANGLDPAMMLAIADIESKFKANAYNPSGASGVFQFIPKTAKGYGLGNPMDANANVRAGMRFTKDNMAYFKKTLGREPTPGEVYLMHQQGMGGATSLMRNPNALAADVVGNKAVSQNGGWAGMTAGQFAGLWTGKMDTTYAAYGGHGFQPMQTAGGGTMGVRPDGSIGPLVDPVAPPGQGGQGGQIAPPMAGRTAGVGPGRERRAMNSAQLEGLRQIAWGSPLGQGFATPGQGVPSLIDQSQVLRSGVQPLNVTGIIG